MERTAEQTRRTMRYALPVIGAAVPAVVMLLRRVTGRRGPRESKDQMLLRESALDLRSAMNTALRYIPGTPVEVELEEEHGMPVWQVEIVPKKGGPTREVLVDAKSGDVLEVRAEYGQEGEEKG